MMLLLILQTILTTILPGGALCVDFGYPDWLCNQWGSHWWSNLKISRDDSEAQVIPFFYITMVSLILLGGSNRDLRWQLRGASHSRIASLEYFEWEADYLMGLSFRGILPHKALYRGIRRKLLTTPDQHLHWGCRESNEMPHRDDAYPWSLLPTTLDWPFLYSNVPIQRSV